MISPELYSAIGKNRAHMHTLDDMQAIASNYLWSVEGASAKRGFHDVD